jgi:hypothetical protein
MRQCEQCGRNRNEKFFKPNGRICFSCQRASRSGAAHERAMAERYGMQPGDYDRLLEAQNYVCAICGGGSRTRLSVDHRHSDGVVRGLLCRRCNNQLLAQGAQDRIDILLKAAEYLADPPAIHTIGERYAPG